MSDEKPPEVEIVPDPIEPDREVVVESKPESDKDKDKAAPTKEFDDLKAQFAALQESEGTEREARQRAEALVRTREQEIVAAHDEIGRTRNRVVQGDYSTVLSAISAAEAERAAAKNDLKTAWDSGDPSRAADAQEKIAVAAAHLVQLYDGKAAIEERAEEARKAPPRQQQRQQPVNQFETQLEQFTPRTKAWVRQHPETMTDQKTHHRAMTAHYDAVEVEKLAPDTDEYFNYLNQRLNYEKPADGRVAVQKHTRSAPAAPVTRAGDSSSLSSDRVKLSGREVRAAEDLGLSLSEYARRKQLMTKEGRYATMMLPSE
jgi:hypothetical protein